MTEELLNRPAVKRVTECLVAAGSAAKVIVLSDTARTAQDAASSLNCELGAIVKSLVGLHGGELHIKSDVGVGTTVTVTLPISKTV